MNAQLESKANAGASAPTKGGEWIDRYVNEVGRRLPANQRADVEREIRSLIEDEVADRLDAAEEQGGSQPDGEATVLAVLQQFGAPGDMAAKYQAPRYLIGPAMFPVYQIVLGIVLAVTVGANLLGLVVAAGTGGVQPLTQTLGNLFEGVLQAFGSVTLVFVGLERLGLRASAQKAAAWEPRSLPPVKDEQRVNMVETAVEVGFTAALLGLAVNYLNGATGAVFFDGAWQPIPLFAEGVLQYIPWLMVLWGIDIVVNIVLLARGRWEAPTRIATLVLALGNAFIFYQMLVGGPLAAWPPLDPAFKITAAIVFAVSLWEAARQGWLLLKGSAWSAGALRSQHVG